MTNIEKIITEIASFYSDSEAAIALMKKYKIGERGEMYLEYLLRKERSFFLKRVSQGIKKLQCVEILESRLDDNRPVEPIPGYGLGFPAYEAEMYYQGSLRFWYE